jgi:putative lipoic acid-binding regulatory protein
MKTRLDKFEYRMNFEVTGEMVPDQVVRDIFRSVQLFYVKFYMTSVSGKRYPNGDYVGVVITDSKECGSPYFNDPKVIGGHFEKGVWIEDWSKPELDLTRTHFTTYKMTKPDQVRLSPMLYMWVRRWMWENRWGDNDIRIVPDPTLMDRQYCLVKYEDVGDMYTRRYW